MAVVQSSGRLEAVQRNWTWRTTPTTSTLSLYGLTQDYASIWRTQPNVRTVVSFLGRNIAQLAIKVYRRTSDTEREHLGDHPLARLLRRPNPYTTRYRAFDALVQDLGIYDNSFWAKLPAEGTDEPGGLLRIPPQFVEVSGENWMRAEGFNLFPQARSPIELRADQVLHFRGHNPDDARVGISPLETLRRVLAEEAASSEYREWMWRNKARIEGVLERPADAPRLSKDAHERLRTQWQELYSGARGSGKTAILEEGTTFKEITMTARDAQYLEARKLSREEVAAAYHIPPPMVGILDRATFSNIDTQHRMLYQDTLAPWLTMIEEEIELQLLSEFSDTDNVYVEFNLAEKLKGSFEEQARAAQASVGAPWMTRNEMRARLNLPPVDDGDRLVVPLNVLTGGQASPLDSAPKALTKAAKQERGALRRRQAHVAKHGQEIQRFFDRQSREVLSELGAKKKARDVDEVFDQERWTNEMRLLLAGLGLNVVEDFGSALAQRFGTEFDVDRTLRYLDENARIAAELVNESTRDDLLAALRSDSPLDEARNLFSTVLPARASQIALTRVTTTANFGRQEAAKQAGRGTKTWTVTSQRSRHPELHGETVPISEPFSNGGMWPGDPALPVEQVAGCACLVDFS